jgi:hypothetical protein
MAHYAFLDENNTVTEVIVGIDENELIDGLNPETWYGNFKNQKCRRTSYNNNIRVRYAGIGFIYDEELDAFIQPKLFPSWLLNQETLNWESPIQYPNDGEQYNWNEETISWQIVESPTPNQ